MLWSGFQYRQLLENQEKINWRYLSKNTNAIHLLEENLHKIDWFYLTLNINAIHLLEENKDKINYNYLSENPNIFEFGGHLLK